MIIAEKILNSKSMRSVSYADYLRNNASRNSAAAAGTSSSTATSELDQDSQANKMSSFLSSSETDESVIADIKLREDKDETDDVPEWLKNDLAEASFIPIKPIEEPKAQNKQTKEHLNDESIKVCVNFIQFYD